VLADIDADFYKVLADKTRTEQKKQMIMTFSINDLSIPITRRAPALIKPTLLWYGGRTWKIYKSMSGRQAVAPVAGRHFCTPTAKEMLAACFH
jgi:hypothetical protein